MITNLRIWILCGVIASVVGAPPVVAQDPPLKGQVQKADTPVRIRRPGLPSPAESAEAGSIKTATASVEKKPPLKGVAENDFLLNFKKQSPILSPSGKTLTSEAEDADLLIEWEAWHHRVSQAIFERWRVLGMFPGVAHTTLSFTRNGRVFCTVHDIELPDNIYDLLQPQYRAYSIDEIKRRFVEAVQNSVLPLEGSSTVQFPEKSKRDIVTMTPHFAGDVDEGYNWQHGDVERVQLH